MRVQAKQRRPQLVRVIGGLAAVTLMTIWVHGQQLAKEYVCLGDRVISVETAGSNPNPVPMPGSKAGVLGQGYSWVLDGDGNQQWQYPGPDFQYAFGGIAGDIPITGDWDGLGRTEIGVFRSSTGYFLLDYDGDGQFNPSTDKYYNFGPAQAGDKRVVGDSNGDRKFKVGLYRGGGLWIVDYNGDGVFNGAVDKSFYFGGISGDIPVAGDWNRNGISKAGVFRSGYLWLLDKRSPADTASHDQFFQFAFGGISGDVTVVGDWNGSGVTKVGVFRQGYFWLLNANNPGDLVAHSVGYAFPWGGIAGDVPVVGKWTQ